MVESKKNEGTTLLLVRHGETVWNKEGRYQGQKNTPLSEEGKLQAKMLQRYLRNEIIDATYTSDLDRAAETARIVAYPHNCQVNLDSRLREMSFGVWEGLTRKQVIDKYEELFKLRYQDSEGTRIPGGEIPSEVGTRMSACVFEIIRRHCGQKVLLVSHGGSIRLLICSVLGMKLSESFRFRLHNTGLCVLSFSKCDPRPLWKIHALNSCVHLTR